ncbi:MAG: AAA family ATPase, partial [Burkholderiaceae bacterium]|nr:AAA family ATPase [Burkholderiaceae bacterium]
ALLTNGLKGNHYLKKALLTGVMRVSHESMLSGLNNIKTFDVFSDRVYTDDYGLTEEEKKKSGWWKVSNGVA